MLKYFIGESFGSTDFLWVNTFLHANRDSGSLCLDRHFSNTERAKYKTNELVYFCVDSSNKVVKLSLSEFSDVVMKILLDNHVSYNDFGFHQNGVDYVGIDTGFRLRESFADFSCSKNISSLHQPLGMSGNHVVNIMPSLFHIFGDGEVIRILDRIYVANDFDISRCFFSIVNSHTVRLTFDCYDIILSDLVQIVFTIDFMNNTVECFDNIVFTDVRSLKFDDSHSYELSVLSRCLCESKELYDLVSEYTDKVKLAKIVMLNGGT